MIKHTYIKIAALIALITSFAHTTHAHVRYLISPEEVAEHGGTDTTFLLDALRDPQNIGLILWTIAGSIIVYLVATQVKCFRDMFKRIGTRADSYTPLSRGCFVYHLVLHSLAQEQQRHLSLLRFKDFPHLQQYKSFLAS